MQAILDGVVEVLVCIDHAHLDIVVIQPCDFHLELHFDAEEVGDEDSTVAVSVLASQDGAVALLRAEVALKLWREDVGFAVDADVLMETGMVRSS